MRRNRKNLLIGFLLAVVLLMSVGYAAFSQSLQISGSSNISSKWDVHIQSITPGTPTGLAKNTSAGLVSGSTTEAYFNAEVQAPGDEITYTVTVVNEGTVSAKLKAINTTNFSDDDPNDPNNPEAIIYTYSGLTLNSTLAPNSTPLTFTVTAKYNDEITSQPDESKLEKEGIIELVFEQA